MKKLLLVIIAFMQFFNVSHGQQLEGLFDRIKGINNYGTQFYTVDGIDISVKAENADFEPNALKKSFKGLKLKNEYFNKTNTKLSFENYHWTSVEYLKNNAIYSSSYFVNGNSDSVYGILFTYPKQIFPNEDFEAFLIDKIVNNAVPDSIYQSIDMNKVKFIDRILELPARCRWMGINNIQFPYNGQMNWSLHYSLESAQNSIENQILYSSSRSSIKIHSDEYVSVIFENQHTKARKIVYKIKGFWKLLMLGNAGSELIVYYVAEKVGDKYVSCVMSHWNNDNISQNGLPYLLSQVMRLE